MTIKHLNCTDFRNLRSVALDFHPDSNLIVGANGAGKTSILESIYYIAHGRSFRSTKQAGLVHFSSDSFSLFLQIIGDHAEVIPVGVSRSLQGRAIIKCHHEKISSISEIAKLLPIKFICSMSHVLLTGGPKVRRAFLDWGLFHVKHDFHTAWKAYSKALISRNALVKQKITGSELDYWDQILLEKGDLLHRHRISYADDIVRNFNENCFLHSDVHAAISFEYLPGWVGHVDFASALRESRYKDFALGYTSVGPHRADMDIKYRGESVANVLSQGQLKLLAYRLHLIQGLMLSAAGLKAPVYLIDDMGSELDNQNIDTVLSVLNEMSSQHIVSCINPPPRIAQSRMFHVEQGKIQSA